MGWLFLSSVVLAGDYYGGIDVDLGKGSTEMKNLGQTVTDDFSQTAFGIHGGYNLNINSQIEISFKSLNFDFDEGEDTDGTQLGVDYIYSFDKISILKPYIGAGVSVNSLDIEISNKDTVDGVGLKLRGGIYYILTPQVDIGVELNYSYIGWEDLKILENDSILESSSSFYGLGLNLNYKF